MLSGLPSEDIKFKESLDKLMRMKRYDESSDNLLWLSTKTKTIEKSLTDFKIRRVALHAFLSFQVI